MCSSASGPASLARSALPHSARGKRTWAMPRARLVNLGPSRWCWPICPNTSPAQAFCTGRRRRKVALVCNGGGGEVMHSLAVTSLPPFFSPFPWRRENQESPGHHHHHGHDGSPISSKVGCLIDSLLWRRGLLCCVKASPIPMAYRRKQGAADDHRSSYPQARTPLSPCLLLCPVCLLVGFLVGCSVPYHFLIADSKVLLQSNLSLIELRSFISRCLDCTNRNRTKRKLLHQRPSPYFSSFLNTVDC